jgi:iron(III) transport system substrate-binding protein
MKPRQLRTVPYRAALAALLAALGACSRGDSSEVVVYCALDQIHSEALLRRFEERTGIRVRAEFDVEAAKTVGLVQRLREERSRPRCDVFWNNEIAHTVALADEGMLARYDSPSAADIPEAFKDAERRWTGFAARARVFIVNTTLADPATIRGLDDLGDPKWSGKACMARPLTGTTLTHVTALYATFGDPWTDAFLARVESAGVSFVQSNGQVMRLVRDGRMAWGLTDTDDFNVAREAGYPVAMIYPDQRDAAHPDARGTLLIPNTVCILKDAPHAENAKKLVDFILSREVEAALAASDAAQIPLRADVARPSHVRSAAELTLMAVDWSAVGRDVQRRLATLKERYLK